MVVSARSPSRTGIKPRRAGESPTKVVSPQGSPTKAITYTTKSRSLFNWKKITSSDSNTNTGRANVTSGTKLPSSNEPMQYSPPSSPRSGSLSSSQRTSPQKSSRRTSPQQTTDTQCTAEGSNSPSIGSYFAKFDKTNHDAKSRDPRFFVDEGDNSTACDYHKDINRFRPNQHQISNMSATFYSAETGDREGNRSAISNTNASKGSNINPRQKTIPEGSNDDASEDLSQFLEDDNTNDYMSTRTPRDLQSRPSYDASELVSEYGDDDESSRHSRGETTHHDSASGRNGDKARFRGFSTSIQSLFLDEQIVCGAMSCFGVLLSSRTEYLLEHRQNLRGKSNQRSQSRIIGISLLLCLLFISSTYIIWGFGHTQQQQHQQNQQQNNDDYYYNNNRERHLTNANDSNNKYMRPWGVAKVKDHQEFFWIPIQKFIEKEYTSRVKVDSFTTDVRSLEDGQNDDDGNNDQNDDYNNNNNNKRYNNNNNYNGNAARSWKEWTEIAPLVRVLLCFVFLSILGIVGRRRRMRTRFAILKARAQEDELNDINNIKQKQSKLLALGLSRSSSMASNTMPKNSYDREDKYDGACSHTLCGCYPTDRFPSSDERAASDTEEGYRRADFIQRLMLCVSNSCCGLLCRFWVQCFSVCALAQEAREVRLLVPIRFQRVDFLTHQPFTEYYKDICVLRHEFKAKFSRDERQTQRMTSQKERFMTHLNALSKLSKILIILFLVSVLVIIMTEQLNPRAVFSWADAFVLIATFAQAFAVIFVVHGIFHKSDLSLDAVIKFFASGFLIGMPTAFLFEAFVLNIVILFAYIFYFILRGLIGDAFDVWIAAHYTLLYNLLELTIAFVVASAVEEFCKYFSFRFVEHPDLLFLTGLDRSSRSSEENFDAGGLVAYPFSSHNASVAASRVGSFDSIATFNQSVGTSRDHRGRATLHPTSQNDDISVASGHTQFGSDSDIRTLREQAAAITTGMISCAMGFACAENFIYVFFAGHDGRYNKSVEEFAILMFRSIFPVHALCAALQSIGLIRKFLEKDKTSRSMGVGKIVLAAIILHGSFDAVLMLADAHIELSWEKFYNGEIELRANSDFPYNAILVNFLAGVGVSTIFLLGLLWYAYQRRNQSIRLKRIELRSEPPEKEWNRRLGYKNPTFSSDQSDYKSEKRDLV